MLEEGKISSSQLLFLTVTLILASAILLLPAFPTKEAQQDSWLSAVLAMTAGLIGAILITALAYRFPGQSPVQYSFTILGKPLGWLVGILYLLFYTHITSILIREVTTTVVTSILPRTPPELLTISIVAAVVYLIRKGFEVIARVNMFVASIAILTVLTVYSLVAREMQLRNITPLLENGLLPIFKGAVTPTGWFGEVVTLGFLLPYVNKLPRARKTICIGIIIVGLLFIIVIIGTIAIFGPGLTANLTFPTLISARQISLGNFIERMEAPMVSTWIVWNYIKTGIFFYVAVMILAQLFKLRDYRPAVFPMGLITAVMSIVLFRNSVQLADFLARVWGGYAAVFEFFIPFLLLIVAIFRRKKGISHEVK